MYFFVAIGSKITNTTRRYQKGSNLHITRVDRERDSGQFTCIAQDQNESITSSSASLNIRCEYTFTLCCILSNSVGNGNHKTFIMNIFSWVLTERFFIGSVWAIIAPLCIEFYQKNDLQFILSTIIK